MQRGRRSRAPRSAMPHAINCRHKVRIACELGDNPTVKARGRCGRQLPSAGYRSPARNIVEISKGAKPMRPHSPSSISSRLRDVFLNIEQRGQSSVPPDWNHFRRLCTACSQGMLSTIMRSGRRFRTIRIARIASSPYAEGCVAVLVKP